MARGLVHHTALTGHRASYCALFEHEFDLAPSTGLIRSFAKIVELLRARCLFFGTLDDDYLGFFVVALLRSVLMRRTAGLFLRPQTCLARRGGAQRLKKLAFAALRYVRPVSVMTITSFDIEPRYRAIARRGVMDPQLWDKAGKACCPDPEMTARITSAAGGRAVLAFVGSVSSIKGAEFLARLAKHPDWPSEQILIVVGGRVDADSRKAVATLAKGGALVVDRFVTDAEIDAVYASAAGVWACYRADYDQASGVFGRAVQTGTPAIVRRDSLISRIARHAGAPMAELDWTDEAGAVGLIRSLVATPGRRAAPPTDAWRKAFIDTVEGAL